MSRNLGCNAVKCSYNLDYLCTADKIDVKGSNATTSEYTDCGTFTQKNIDNRNPNSEIKSVFKSNEGKMSPEIICDAMQCRFNSDKHCTSNNVMIKGQGAESAKSTECETFS